MVLSPHLYAQDTVQELADVVRLCVVVVVVVEEMVVERVVVEVVVVEGVVVKMALMVVMKVFRIWKKIF